MNKEKNFFFMEKALHQATLALKKDEVPIGAIVINEKDVIIARGYNKVESLQTQLAHAEMLTIRTSCKKSGNWRLNGCWIYVTLEPCLMCFGLIQLSRFEGIVFGASSPLFGAGLDNVEKLRTYSKSMKIIGGIKEQESLNLLKTFFHKARKKRKAVP